MLFLCSAACERYEAPPRIESSNLTRGAYDQDEGPLRLTFEKPLDPTTLRLSVFLDRTNVENDLCVAGEEGMPAGCEREAVSLAGPCERRPDSEFRLDDPSQGRAYRCPGGSFIISPDDTTLSISLESALIPFERYVLVFEPGLANADGRTLRIPLVQRFQAAGAFELGPIDFEPGMYFTVFDVTMPVNAQFHFLFYVWVNRETGETRMFGADLDPKDETVQPDSNRNPADWILDPNPPTGATIAAIGQMADTSGGRALAVFPFQLKIVQPAIEAADTELSGNFRSALVAGGPSDERETVSGSMFAARVFLGDGGSRAELGSGSGRIFMFRLDPAEEPPVEALLPDGVTLADVLPELAAGR